MKPDQTPTSDGESSHNPSIQEVIAQSDMTSSQMSSSDDAELDNVQTPQGGLEPIHEVHGDGEANGAGDSGPPITKAKKSGKKRPKSKRGWVSLFTDTNQQLFY